MSALPVHAARPIRPALRLVPGPDRAEVSASVETSFAAVAALRAEWDDLAAATDAPIEMTFDWCRTWWRRCGAEDPRRALRLVVLRAGADLVGVLPMFVERLGRGPLRVRVAKIVGSDCTQSVCDPPAQPGWAGVALEAALRHLVGAEGCDAIALGPLTADRAQTARLREVLLGRDDLVRLVRDRPCGVRTAVALPGSFDAWLATLTRNQRSNVRRSLRRLDGAGRVTETIGMDPSAHEALVAMHARQWAARGRGGHFADWPGSAAFHADLLASLGPDGRAFVHRLDLDGACVARQAVHRHGSRASCRCAARAVDARLDDTGLGRASLARLFARLAADGVTSVDLGLGAYDYKQRLGGVEREVRTMLACAPRALPALRTLGLAAASAAIDRAYYRAWRVRLAPRLRPHLVPGAAPRRPLAAAWIRTRV